MSYSSCEFYAYDGFKHIEKLRENYLSDIEYYNQKVLKEYPEALSLFNDYQDRFLNTYIVLCANSFEQYFENEFPKIFSKKSKNSHYSFLINQALKRKYFTLFNWNAKNANQFYGLFGREFSESMKDFEKTESSFEGEAKQFIALGAYRNKLVYNGMKNDVPTPDISFIYKMFQDAQNFCDKFFLELLKTL